jgi:hypothetical protein
LTGRSRFRTKSCLIRARTGVLRFNTDLLVAVGVTDPGDVDIFTALIGGLLTQQQANDPGGDRWMRHLDAVLEMFFNHVDSRKQTVMKGRS